MKIFQRYVLSIYLHTQKGMINWLMSIILLEDHHITEQLKTEKIVLCYLQHKDLDHLVKNDT